MSIEIGFFKFTVKFGPLTQSFLPADTAGHQTDLTVNLTNHEIKRHFTAVQYLINFINLVQVKGTLV